MHQETRTDRQVKIQRVGCDRQAWTDKERHRPTDREIYTVRTFVQHTNMTDLPFTKHMTTTRRESFFAANLQTRRTCGVNVVVS